MVKFKTGLVYITKLEAVLICWIKEAHPAEPGNVCGEASAAQREMDQEQDRGCYCE